MAANVKDYINEHAEWQHQLTKLHTIMLGCGLEESIKWGMPAYSSKGKLLIGVGAFKAHVAIWFHHGANLKDPAKKLINAQQGKTKAMSQWRLSDSDTIDRALLTAYVNEAIANDSAGLKISPGPRPMAPIPAALATALSGNAALKTAFEALSPGKQKDYVAHVAEAKRSSTQQSRTEKITPMILRGEGLNDRYRR